MRIVSVVLAAGEGRRVGGPKALLRIEGETFLRRACALAARPSIAAVVAVVGAEAERVCREADAPDGVELVENPLWREGMLSSVLCGLERADALAADAVLLHPVDCPFVATRTVEAVAAALAGGAAIAVPSFAGRRGHPGGFSRSVFPELRAAPPEHGARAVLAAIPARVVHVPGDPGCIRSVDTPEDLARLRG